MKRTLKTIVCCSCLSLFHPAQSGTMGYLSPSSFGGHGILPYATIEGYPVWINFGGLTFSNNGDSQTSDKGYPLSGGARIAGGFTYPHNEVLDFNAEAGWNYFGSTSGNSKGTTIGASLSGVDILLGVAYKWKAYEGFAKVGALFEKINYNINMPNQFIVIANPYVYYSSIDAKGVISEVLPELKVGVTYNVNDNWAASVSYMHAFGDAPGVNAYSITPPYGQTSGNVTTSVSSNLQAASLNAIMFGVRYQLND